MTEAVTAEARAAADALLKRINLAESEVAKMELVIAEKRGVISAWRQLVASLLPDDPAHAKKEGLFGIFG